MVAKVDCAPRRVASSTLKAICTANARDSVTFPPRDSGCVHPTILDSRVGNSRSPTSVQRAETGAAGPLLPAESELHGEFDLIVKEGTPAVASELSRHKVT